MALLKLQTALENALAPQSRFKPLVLAVHIWAPCVPGRAQPGGGRIFCEDAESLCAASDRRAWRREIAQGLSRPMLGTCVPRDNVHY